MSHHSSDPESARKLNKMLEQAGIKQRLDESPFGATGKFPKGQLNSSDEGEISFGIAHAGGKVLINFNKPVAWLGLEPKQAELLAQSLLHHAALSQKET